MDAATDTDTREDTIPPGRDTIQTDAQKDGDGAFHGVIDPFIRQQQDEWEYLLQISANTVSFPFAKEDLFGTVQHRHRLASIWLKDAIHARAIDYPRSDVELERLTIARKESMRQLFNIAAIIQTLSPFLSRPICDLKETRETGWDWFNEGGPPSVTALAVLDLLCLMIFAIDLFYALGVNYSRKSFLNKPWTSFRTLGSMLLLISICFTFSGQYTVQLYLRCIFPIFMISRRNNLKLMLQGLLHSAYHTKDVILALLGIIAMWGFIGFFLFRSVEVDASRFATPLHGMFTALHAFTSRPFTLLVMNTLFYYDATVSGLYFVTLTLAADIICTAFVIAVGNRQYKLFASKILSKRLLDRKQAVSAVYIGMADPEKGFKSEDWIKLMAELKGSRYHVDQDSAELLFSMEDHELTGYVNEEGFFRMIGALACRITFSDQDKAQRKRRKSLMISELDSKDSKNDDARNSGSTSSTSIGRGLSNNSDDKIELSEQSSERAGKDTGNPMHGGTASAESKLSPTAESGVTSGGDPEEAKAPPSSAHKPTTSVDKGHHHHTYNVNSLLGEELRDEMSDDIKFMPTRIETRESGDSDVPPHSSINFVDGTRARAYSKRELSIDGIPTSKDLNSDATLLLASGDHGYMRAEDDSPYSLEEERILISKYCGDIIAQMLIAIVFGLRVLFSFQMVIKVPAKNPCVAILEYDDIRKYKNEYVSYSIPLYNTTFVFVMHVALIVQLCYVSHPNETHHGWTHFGWVLEMIFWMDMMCKFVVFGIKGLGRSKFVRMTEVAVNIASLVTMVVLEEVRAKSPYGDYVDDGSGNLKPSATLLALIIIQSIRIFKLFFLFNDSSIFDDILPTLLRAFFILFSVIYFFSVFAHGFFCSDLCNTCPNEDIAAADDDSRLWLDYQDILNFNSFLQTVFTMFELALLSNWSIVMDAAEKQAGPRAYVFFYIYRLALTLCVVPILVSFMMNSFISAVMKKEQRRNLKGLGDAVLVERHLKTLNNDFDEDTTVGDEKEALAEHTMNTGGVIQQNDALFPTGHQGEDDDDGDDNNQNMGRKGGRSTMASVAGDLPRESRKSRYSIMSNISNLASSGWFALPGVSFQTGHGGSDDYKVTSKGANKNGSSMLSLWSGESTPAVAHVEANRESLTARNSLTRGSTSRAASFTSRASKQSLFEAYDSGIDPGRRSSLGERSLGDSSTASSMSKRVSAGSRRPSGRKRDQSKRGSESTQNTRRASNTDQLNEVAEDYDDDDTSVVSDAVNKGEIAFLKQEIRRLSVELEEERRNSQAESPQEE